jgi:hypothetical protein
MTNSVVHQLHDSEQRRVVVKFPGGHRPPQQIHVSPGGTASQLLDHLGLDSRNYVISKGSAGTEFGADEDLHSSTSNGEWLYVTSRVDAGSG